jgi:hypothetical protein
MAWEVLMSRTPTLPPISTMASAGAGISFVKAYHFLLNAFPASFYFQFFIYFGERFRRGPDFVRKSRGLVNHDRLNNLVDERFPHRRIFVLSLHPLHNSEEKRKNDTGRAWL